MGWRQVAGWGWHVVVVEVEVAGWVAEGCLLVAAEMPATEVEGAVGEVAQVAAPELSTCSQAAGSDPLLGHHIEPSQRPW